MSKRDHVMSYDVLQSGQEIDGSLRLRALTFVQFHSPEDFRNARQVFEFYRSSAVDLLLLRCRLTCILALLPSTTASARSI